MVVLLEDEVRLRQNGIVLEVRVVQVRVSEFLVGIDVALLELLEVHLQGSAELDGHLLLLLEDDLVILHVLFGVGLQVRSQLVQIKAVFVRAFLAAQEELAELGRAE